MVEHTIYGHDIVSGVSDEESASVQYEGSENENEKKALGVGEKMV